MGCDGDRGNDITEADIRICICGKTTSRVTTRPTVPRTEGFPRKLLGQTGHANRFSVPYWTACLPLGNLIPAFKVRISVLAAVVIWYKGV